MGDIMSDPTSAAVHIGICKVNAVARHSYLISRFCQRLYRQTENLIQPRLAAEATRVARKRYA